MYVYIHMCVCVPVCVIYIYLCCVYDIRFDLQFMDAAHVMHNQEFPRIRTAPRAGDTGLESGALKIAKQTLRHNG